MRTEKTNRLSEEPWSRHRQTHPLFIESFLNLAFIIENMISRLYEKAEGKIHIPKYTKGCWGQPTRKQCYLCKIRTVISIFKIAYRIRNQSKTSMEEEDSETSQDRKQ